MMADGQAEEPQRASAEATSTVAESVPPEEAQMLSTVIRVLSQTMNQSLAELGYFPSLGVMVQELRKQNREFHEVTVKLHSDNHVLHRDIDLREQHIQKLQAELDAYKRDFFRTNEWLKQITSERDHLYRIIQNGVANGPQHISSPMAPQPPPFASVGPAYASDAPEIHPYGHHRVPMMYDGAPGASPELSFNRPPPAAIPVPVIQNYHMADPGMQPPPGVGRQVVTTAIVPSHVAPSNWPESRPSSRPASRRNSESTTTSNVGDAASKTQKSSGLSAIRITPPTQAGRLGTIRIVPAQTVGQPSPVPAFTQRARGTIDLTESVSKDAVASEEPVRKRRRTTQTAGEPVLLAQPPLDLATLGDQLSQLEQHIASPKPQAEVPLPAPAPEADEETDDDDGDKDADGLVRVDVCIKIAFEEKEGKMWCKMCQFRNVKAVTDEPPVPMPTTQHEDLVKHLEDVHPAGWRRLRGVS